MIKAQRDETLTEASLSDSSHSDVHNNNNRIYYYYNAAEQITTETPSSITTSLSSPSSSLPYYVQNPIK